MIPIAEMLSGKPGPLWKQVRQAGATHAVLCGLQDEGTQRWWEFMPLMHTKKRLEDSGLQVGVIEQTPPMQKIRLGLTGRDEEIEQFNALVRNMGALGIPVLCYNFMAVLGWTRTSTLIPGRGGALVTGYDHDVMRNAPLTEYGEVPEERLWESLDYFLKRAMPVAEKAKVKLAMHPDDPPLSPLRGIGRIMRTVDNYQRLLDMAPSEVNGITLCQGNFTLMSDDLPGVIRKFGKQKIFFVHFRDVRGTPEHFVETFHEAGKTDMLACMRAYKEVGYDGVLRPDHVPTMEGDSNDNPAYSTLGRLLAIGYIKGLQEAVYGKEAQN